MKSEVRKTFDAYRNVFALMANRGYRPAEGHEMQDFEQFKVTAKSWENPDRQFWVVFERDEEFVDVAFPGAVDKKQAEGILAHLTAGGSRGTAPRGAHAIIVYDKITPDGKKELMHQKKQNLSRTDNLLVNKVEYFTIVTMQINPLTHSDQPPVIRLITDEEQKEQLRRSLVAAATDKNMQLSALMPLIFVNGPLSVWFDAYVGDVFYFVRNDGTSYFRIVQPDPMIEIGAKKKAL